jgi:hypothetical protein
LGDKPIIRIAVPGDTAEDFMQAAAKQFRGDFFVAIDQPVGKFVRIEAPFLNGDVGVRGDAIAMPAVRNGRKGLVIRLVRLDPDSLGIPIQESSKALGIEDDDDAVEEFDSSQATVASNVSAAVAKSIRAAGNAAPVKPMGPSPTPSAGIPKPAVKVPSQPIKLEELDDETREAVNEFGEASTRASELSADLAKQLAEPAPVTAHAVRRVTPEQGVPKQVVPPKGLPDLPPGADEDEAIDSAFDDPDVHGRATVLAPPLAQPDQELSLDAAEPLEEPAPKVKQSGAATTDVVAKLPATKSGVATDIVDKLPAAKPVEAPKSNTTLLLILLLVVALGAGAFFLLK